MNSWIENELKGSEFPDVRLGKRFENLVDQLSNGMGKSLPLACQDWASTKAAYRFLDNGRVSEAEILEGHFQATRSRFDASTGTVLVLHDTTEFSFHRERTEAIGQTRTVPLSTGRNGRSRLHTVCGVLMHSSLTVTPEGLPLGLTAVKFWTRKKFKGTNALKSKVNATRIPIEQKESIRWIDNVRQSTAILGDPARCVHIGDRESDIYELFCASQEAGTHFLVRTCVDRLAGDGEHTIAHEMNDNRVQAVHRIEVTDKNGVASTAVLEIKYRRVAVLPPIGKQKRYPSLSLTVIHARERGEPKNRDRLDWKLMTDLPVTSRRDAIEKLNWYTMRWKIETFHKILKSGCKAEDSKLRTAQRLTNLIAIFCILGWRILWLTMINRVAPDAHARLVFTDTEMKLLDQLVAAKDTSHTGTVSRYLIRLAKLGGYLDRTSDPPPGNMVIWRGLSRLTDIHLGFSIAKKLVGN